MKRRWMLATSFLLVSLLLSSCSALAKKPVLHAWPKYASTGLAGFSPKNLQMPPATSCSIRAVDLIGAWVAAKTPENDPFNFTDANGNNCQGTFEKDVLPLFTTANLWYAGAPSCRICHSPEVNKSYARMDLSSYQGILSGSARESAQAQGEDILGGGDWAKAMLYEHLVSGEMPPNRPAGGNPKGPLVSAGSH